MTATFHHVHIKSKEPRASARWWADMFGATVLPELQFGAMLFAPVELEGVQITITGPAPGEEERIGDSPPVPHYGLEHVGLVIEDLDAHLARFEEQGLTVYERRPGAGGYDIAYVATPDQVCLELMQPPQEREGGSR